MSHATDILNSAETRRVAVRMRPDLQVERHRVQGRTAWTVKDPVSLRYFQLTDEEHTVLRLLNGRASLHGLKTELETRYPPRLVTHSEVQWLLQLFHQRGLVVADALGQGGELLRRRREVARRQVFATVSSPLFIRLSGVDPEKFLAWLYPKFRWIYNGWSLLAGLLLVLSALTLVTVQIDSVYALLPTFQQFFATQNVIWLMVALMVTKVLHELGHALTCKHFGGECHEIGVAFLVFTPCLYCDTSDSWMLPSRWHRAAIGAAGMSVEILLASLCTFLWWFSRPGILHYLCLDIMFVCSVSTVIFNGNPLLRYDGYYILSDLLEIPNLMQRARSALVRVASQLCLGLKWASDVVVPQRGRAMFALYAVAATCYRWIVLFAILWFLTTVLEPYGLQVLGQAVTVMILAALVMSPVVAISRFLKVPGRIRQVKLIRLLVTVTVVLMLGAAVLFVPLPHRVMTTVILQPRDPARIYVESPGTLDQVHVQPGMQVEPEQVLAKLTNRDVDLEVAQLTGRRDRLAIQLKNLRRRQGQDHNAAEQIPHTQTALADLEDRLRSLHRDQARLTLRAPVAGVIMPPPHVPAAPAEQSELIGWSGLPDDPRNRGCLLETGTLFCFVGDPGQMEAVLVIEQRDVDFVREGQLVELKLDEYPSETLAGRIEQVAEVNLRVAPPELSHNTGGGVQTVTDESGVERTLNVSYQARVRLDGCTRQVLPGFRGRARIQVGDQPLGRRLWRLVNEVFYFH